MIYKCFLRYPEGKHNHEARDIEYWNRKARHAIKRKIFAEPNKDFKIIFDETVKEIQEEIGGINKNMTSLNSNQTNP